jgi:hypothetical protein
MDIRQPDCRIVPAWFPKESRHTPVRESGSNADHDGDKTLNGDWIKHALDSNAVHVMRIATGEITDDTATLD